MIKKSFRRTTADKWFSIFIRLRDAQHGGMVQCCTCGAVWNWKEVDCGHFVPRNKPLRFNEQNAHAQCIHCNRFCDGKQFEHGLYIDNLYGKGTAEKLINLGNMRGNKGLAKLDLKYTAKKYRIKVKKLAKIKGITL